MVISDGQHFLNQLLVQLNFFERTVNSKLNSDNRFVEYLNHPFNLESVQVFDEFYLKNIRIEEIVNSSFYEKKCFLIKNYPRLQNLILDSPDATRSLVQEFVSGSQNPALFVEIVTNPNIGQVLKDISAKS